MQKSKIVRDDEIVCAILFFKYTFIKNSFMKKNNNKRVER